MFVAALICLLMLSLPLLSGGVYYGRAWGDQLNYTLVADYVLNLGGQEEKVSQPHLRTVVDGKLLDDRIGQAFLQAFVSLTSLQDLTSSFYLCSIIGILMGYCACYIVARLAGSGEWLAAGVACLISISPPLHAIHLESFLSQTLGTPAIVAALAFESMLLNSFSWLRLLACALVSAFVLAGVL